MAVDLVSSAVGAYTAVVGSTFGPVGTVIGYGTGAIGSYAASTKVIQSFNEEHLHPWINKYLGN